MFFFKSFSHFYLKITFILLIFIFCFILFINFKFYIYINHLQNNLYQIIKIHKNIKQTFKDKQKINCKQIKQVIKTDNMMR